MTKMKREVRKIMKELNPTTQSETIALLSTMLQRVKLNDWNKVSYITEINNSELHEEEKNLFTNRLTNNVRYSDSMPRMQRGIQL
jgi:hypothetical protein